MENVKSIYIHEEAIDGVGKIEFLPIPMIELSPTYRKAIAMISEGSTNVSGIDSDASGLVGIIADLRTDEIRNLFFKHMVFNEQNIWTCYEAIMSKHGILFETVLFAAGVKTYLLPQLKLAMKSDSVVKKAIVALFPAVESLLTGFSGTQLSEKLQAIVK